MDLYLSTTDDLLASKHLCSVLLKSKTKYSLIMSLFLSTITNWNARANYSSMHPDAPKNMQSLREHAKNTPSASRKSRNKNIQPPSLKATNKYTKEK